MPRIADANNVGFLIEDSMHKITLAIPEPLKARQAQQRLIYRWLEEHVPNAVIYPHSARFINTSDMSSKIEYRVDIYIQDTTLAVMAKLMFGDLCVPS